MLRAETKTKIETEKGIHVNERKCRELFKFWWM